MNSERFEPLSSASPEFWMEQLKEGKEEALAHLMTRFERPVFSFLHKKLRGEIGVVQELTQEVFLKCLQNCHRFESGRPVAAWLFTLAANTATDHLRKRGRELQTPETFDLPDPIQVSPWDQIDQHRKLDSLRASLEELTHRQRAMVVAYYINERPIRNIAEDFGCAEGTVKATLFQSLVKLRKSLGYSHEPQT
ncbi:MAG: RNA polymerase sigma factor [Holophagaceae bacterium]|nr:RNA polymerase sigma factor [Holophagaceae bacterium]